MVRQRNDSERLRTLRAERERVCAELNAVEDGTLPFIEEHGDVTAEALAEAFDLSLPAANNRLVRLVEVGLLDRRPQTRRPVGGRFYVYRRAA